MSFIPVVVSEVSAILHIVTSIMTKIASLGCKFQKNISILNWLYLQVACSQCITPLQPRTLDIKWSIGREVLLTRGLYNLLLPSPQLTWTLTSAFRTKINFLFVLLSQIERERALDRVINQDEFLWKVLRAQDDKCDSVKMSGAASSRDAASAAESSDWRRERHLAVIGLGARHPEWHW